MKRLESIPQLRRGFSQMGRNSQHFKLREYQKDAVQSVLDAVASGVKRSAVVLATGGGKTVVIGDLISKLKSEDSTRKRTLVLAHKEELVRQAARTIALANPDYKVQIDMHKSKPEDDCDVIVGSVPTLVRMTRLNKYDPSQYKTIILDECHHATARSWTKIMTHFGALDDNSPINVVGFTATLERADGAALGSVFHKVVFERSLRTMVEQRELCDVKFSLIKTDVNLSDVPIQFGDYQPATLSSAVNKDNINLQVARAFAQLREKLQFKSTLVFCVDIAHCKTLCGVFQRQGINAQYVTGDTVKHERQAILEDFKNGKISVLCNVLVFTEGTDIPNIDSMILARPTKSRPLLIQMIGRGLRLHEGKDVCHIIDMVGNAKLGILSVPNLFGLPENFNYRNKSLLEIEKEKEELDVIERERQMEEQRQSIKEVMELQTRLANVDIQFDTLEGFAALEGKIDDNMADTKEVNRKVSASPIPWVRLEYHLWGYQPLTNNVSYVIKRIGEDSDTEFVLYRREQTPIQYVIASNYKCARSTDYELTRGTVDHVLAVAELQVGGNIFIRKSRGEKAITARQKESLVSGLKNKIMKMYGSEKLEDFKSALAGFDQVRASSLVFAMKHSINSLWVKWELTVILGPTPQIELRLERERSRLSKLIRAKLTAKNLHTRTGVSRDLT